MHLHRPVVQRILEEPSEGKQWKRNARAGNEPLFVLLEKTLASSPEGRSNVGYLPRKASQLGCTFSHRLARKIPKHIGTQDACTHCFVMRKGDMVAPLFGVGTPFYGV